MSQPMRCRCGSDWWLIERQEKLDLDEVTHNTAPGAEPAHLAVRVVVRCAHCGARGPATGSSWAGHGTQAGRGEGGPHLRRDDP